MYAGLFITSSLSAVEVQILYDLQAAPRQKIIVSCNCLSRKSWSTLLYNFLWWTVIPWPRSLWCSYALRVKTTHLTPQLVSHSRICRVNYILCYGTTAEVSEGVWLEWELSLVLLAAAGAGWLSPARALKLLSVNSELTVLLMLISPFLLKLLMLVSRWKWVMLFFRYMIYCLVHSVCRVE